jgi:hypothetical protein
MTPALAVEPNALPAVRLIRWIGDRHPLTSSQHNAADDRHHRRERRYSKRHWPSGCIRERNSTNNGRYSCRPARDC